MGCARLGAGILREKQCRQPIDSTWEIEGSATASLADAYFDHDEAKSVHVSGIAALSLGRLARHWTGGFDQSLIC